MDIWKRMDFRKPYRTLSRKKPIESSTPTKLVKVLSALDLTALGIGSTLGVGIYVLAGYLCSIFLQVFILFLEISVKFETKMHKLNK